MKIAVFSGGYDPLHWGHIEGFIEAKQWADKVVVGINSDQWLKKKKGFVFMPFVYRLSIVDALRQVDEVYGFDDSDNTAIKLIYKVLQVHKGDIVFCNGGDVTKCPEEATDPWPSRVSFLYNVGGGKIESSSALVLKAYEELKKNKKFKVC